MEVLAGPPLGLPPDRRPEFELHIETGKATMPPSRPMLRLSEEEMEECHRQVQWLLDNSWICPWPRTLRLLSSRARQMGRGGSAKIIAG